MKKSQAVQIIEDYLDGISYIENQHLHSRFILSIIENEIGMLPPEKIEIYDNHRIMKHEWDEE